MPTRQQAAVAQAVRPQTTEKTFEKVFPIVKGNEQQSALFVKKLLAVAVSNVTYVRGIFPDFAYGDRSLNGINLKVLNDDCDCVGAKQVIKWLKGCFDALDKKFMRTLIMGIYSDPKEPETFIEAYTFKFSYNANGGVDVFDNNGEKLASACTDEDIKRATLKLLRTVVVLSHTLAPLPDEVLITMKIMYYDDVTPDDYEPPGFGPASPSFTVGDEPRNIKIGDVDTAFHNLKLRVKTDNSMILKSGQISESKVNEEMHSKPVEDKMEKVENEEEEPVQVRCGCQVNEDEGLMIMCSYCNTWQHGICFGIMNETDAPDLHICHNCCDRRVGRPCTDLIMENMAELELLERCQWRRAVFAILEFPTVHPVPFYRRLSVEQSVAMGLLNKMKEAGIIYANGKQQYKKVNHDRARAVLSEILLSKDGVKIIDVEPIDALADQTANLNMSAEKPAKKYQHMEENFEDEADCRKVEKERAKDKLSTKKRKRTMQEEDMENQFQFVDQMEEDEEANENKRYKKASGVKKPSNRKS